jgi:hypothetical protein
MRAYEVGDVIALNRKTMYVQAVKFVGERQKLCVGAQLEALYAPNGAWIFADYAKLVRTAEEENERRMRELKRVVEGMERIARRWGYDR